MEEVSGRVEAIAGNKSGIKIAGKWYNVEQNVQKFLPSKGAEVTATLREGKINFIKEKTNAKQTAKVQRSVIVTQDDIEEGVAKIKQGIQDDLKWALICTNDAILEAEKVLQKKLNFTSEDVEKMAVMAFLQLQRLRTRFERKIRGDMNGNSNEFEVPEA